MVFGEGLPQSTTQPGLPRLQSHHFNLMTLGTQGVDPGLASDVRSLQERSFSNYPYASFFKDHFVSSLERGDHQSVLAFQEGRVVGHSALVRSSFAARQHAKAQEVGRVFADPEVRNKGLGQLLVQGATALGEQQKAEYTFADCSTARPFSTKAFQRAGYAPVGLTLGKWVDTYRVWDFTQRESAWTMVKINNPDILRHRLAFVPEELLPLVTAIYEVHGAEREIEVLSSAQPLAVHPSQLDFKIDGKSQGLEVLVDRVGFDLVEQIDALLNKGQAGLETVRSATVYLKLNSPAVRDAFQSLQRLGFFVSSVWPGFGRDEQGSFDVVGLQYLHPEDTREFNSSVLQIPGIEREAEIQNLILNEFEKVRQGLGPSQSELV